MSQHVRVSLVLLLLGLSACAAPQPQRCSGVLEPINAPVQSDHKAPASHER